MSEEERVPFGLKRLTAEDIEALSKREKLRNSLPAELLKELDDYNFTLSLIEGKKINYVDSVIILDRESNTYVTKTREQIIAQENKLVEMIKDFEEKDKTDV